MSSTRVTSMEFLTGTVASAKNQLLAVGDMFGNLHVFDMPRSLWRPNPNEKQLMSTFIEREVERVDYVRGRMLLRQEEAQAEGEGENEAGDQPPQPPPSRGGAAVAPGPEDQLDMDSDAESLAVEEAKYKELERKFIEQL